MTSEPIIICHLGVGSTPLLNKKKAGLLLDLAKKAASAGFNVLVSEKNRAALKAVEVAVNVLEESGMTNSGIGAVTQNDGVRRCDASIMDGVNLSCGAVSSLENIKYPVSIARKLLDFSELGVKDKTKFRENFYYCGYLVDKVFEIHGETIPDDWKVNSQEKIAKNPASILNNHGETVGAVAIDMNGHLAAATSTGGLKNAFPGRIGDTPLIGSGTYANQYCAVSNTGRGENIIKIVGAKRVCDLVSKNRMNAMLAVDKMQKEYGIQFMESKSTIGTIAIDFKGNWTVNFNGARMTWAMKTRDKGFCGQNPSEKIEY
ncbi:MAG: isoaspartyl peptidase/L-asparaginase [Promethearchaeota archaeon]